MKNFLLGGLVFLCIGAGVTTSTEIITVKPVTPKSSVVFYFSKANSGVAKIQAYKKKGFVISSFQLTDDENYGSNWVHGIVVMEKY